MIALLLAACVGAGDVHKAPPAPEPIGDAECAVCGMVVAEQPSPRAQAAHRDGTHAHLCSVGDLRAWLAAPSPHGEVLATWVETLSPGFDPADASRAPLPWVDAGQAGYVVGIERRMVMGRPVLTYADPATAAAEATRLGGRAVGWDALLAAPFSEDPP